MHAIDPLAVLVMAQSRSEALFKAKPNHAPTLKTEQWVMFGVLFSVLLIITLIWSWIIERRRRPRPYHGPRRLFWSLCRAHGLRMADRWILWSVARHHRLSDPALVFLEPDRLDLTELKPGLRAHAKRIGALRKTLFGELGPPDPKKSGSSDTSAQRKPPTSAAPAPTSSPRLDLPPWDRK